MTIDAKIFDLNYSNPKVVELVIQYVLLVLVKPFKPYKLWVQKKQIR